MNFTLDVIIIWCGFVLLLNLSFSSNFINLEQYSKLLENFKPNLKQNY